MEILAKIIIVIFVLFFVVPFFRTKETNPESGEIIYSVKSGLTWFVPVMIITYAIISFVLALWTLGVF